MIKVFLVEDEFITREGIKKNIDWEAHGYDFCGEASDGELAFPMICKLCPDIVITDIKMPFMNGIELSKLIKRECPETEIIILSGYEEFEYAKEGINIGVAEYLLKPISGAELLEHVDSVAEKINEKQRDRLLFERYKKEMQENSYKDKTDLFEGLVTENSNVIDMMSLAEKLKLSITSLWYNIVLMKVSSKNHKDSEFSATLVKLTERLDGLAEGGKILAFDRDLEGYALIFMGDSEEELNSLRNKYISEVENILKEYENISYFGGIGTNVNRLSELPNSFEMASRAFAHRYIVEGSRILSWNETENAKKGDDAFNISSLSPKQVNRGRVTEFLKSGDREEVKFFVEELFGDLGQGALNSTLFRQYIAMDTYFCVADFVESLESDRNMIEVITSDSKAILTPEDTLAYFIRIIGEGIEIRDNIALNKYDKIVEKVISYVAERYSDEELTISEISSYVNFSPNHLSTIFRNQTGQTLIKYLTDYRLNKAREMLKCSSMRSSEISEAVGYRDPHYFSYLFKKAFGITPTQYREGKQG